MSRFVFLALVLLHGGFAGGMVPVLNVHLGPLAPWAFALYFAGMVGGQAAIHRWSRLSSHRRSLAHWELLFAAALLGMASLPTRDGFLIGRFIEGIGSGMTLPILFARAVRLDWGTAERRIGLMNSAFAIGFVTGPAAAAALVPAIGTPVTLVGFALLFAVAGAAVGQDPRAGAEAAPARARGGLTLFLPLFIAKATYGYMLATISGHAGALFPGLAIGWIMLAMAGLFVVGQVVVAALFPRFGPRLVALAPLALALATATFAVVGAGPLLALIALAQSALLLIGYRNFQDVPSSARTFALYNLLSDPGMVIGAVLALGGASGAWGLAGLGVVTLFVAQRAPAAGRAT